MPELNLDQGMPQTSTPAWRMQAIRLAFERDLVGTAVELDLPDAEPLRVFSVPSALKRHSHQVHYSPVDGTTGCDCEAGDHNQPCSHAGAALLLVVRCAPSGRWPS